MLTNATKRKIDTARDILVGKIPVPTSQVEQITLALVYKFMSDMDKKAKDLGDSSGFFANGYEKYSWGKLMDKALPARERVLLYREALEKMSLNPHIPQLFRDVFRDASLPFNDPETLKLFLDVIDQFEYDHSEELGNAFEYLLQVMGSQGDAGQFRTPRHIIDFIVDVVEPSKTDKILDPACGTAGFLISAYNHIKKKGLSSDEMTQLSENFVGYDISQDMQRLSLVNLYLHHFPNPHIFEYDTLSSEDRWNDNFDVILANPPFMTPKGGIRPHNRFSVPSTRAEVLFVDYIMEHLTARGKAGIVVPEGIIFQSQNAYKQLRKMMVEENYLWAVVSLPGGVFNPYSGVKTSILLFDREIAKRTNKILFVKVNNDGFDLGAQRREIDKNDLPVAQQLLLKYKNAILNGKELSLDDVLDMGGGTSDKDMMNSYGFDLNANSHIELEQIINKAYEEVNKNRIKDLGYNLNGDRYEKTKVLSTAKLPMVKLEEIIDIDFGERITKTDKKGTKYPVYGGGGESFRTDQFNRENDFVIARFAMSENCVRFVEGQFWLMDSGGTFSIKNNYQNKVTKEYVGKVLLGIQREIFRCARGGAQKNLNKEQFYEIEIPVPLISEQNEIVEELDRYQKIIDGANQVVENYKPSFDIDNNWEWVELGNVCKTFSGGTPRREKYEYWNGDIPWVKTAEVNYNVITNTTEFITEEGLKNSSAKIAEPGTILMALYGQGKTRGRVAKLGIKAAMNQACLAIIPNDELDNDYLYYFLQTSYEQLRNMSIGGNQSNLSASTVQKLKIPLPPKTIQIEIAKRLKTEQDAIKSVENIIPIYEAKIKKVIDNLWNAN